MRNLRRAFEFLKPRQFAMRRESCAACGFPLQVRLRSEEMGVRCLRCGASTVTQSLVEVLLKVGPALKNCDIYELSAAGPLVGFLAGCSRSLTCSEYFEGIPSGTWRDGVLCQNVEYLSFTDSSFDLCTATEVFEHVASDQAGFREIYRVLRPGGGLVFTVPINLNAGTVERTALSDGKRIEILPAEYHADRYRGKHVFCYRNYGRDIVERLQSAGFSDVNIHQPERFLFGFSRPVITAFKSF